MQGGNPPWTGCPSIAGCTETHTHSDRDNVDMLIHLNAHISGMWRKLEYLERESHADLGRMCKLHTGSGPS